MKIVQRQQQSCLDVSDDRWLAMLVDTFESVERLESIPCDSASMSALRARLELPAMPNVEPGLAGKAMGGEGAATCHDAVQLDHQH